MYSIAYDLLRSSYHRVKRHIGVYRGINHNLKPEIRLRKKRFGTFYGGWVIAPKALPRSNPIVYSFGLGEDISFDLAMIQSYGAVVHGFDPTPTLADWGHRSDLPAEFHFHDIGLANLDGTLAFGAPTQIGLDDYTVLRGDSDNVVHLRVARLQSLMRDLGHTHVDLVKMDIEGAEFDALRDLVESGVRPTQLLVEFHYLHSRDELKRTLDCVNLLRKSGYRIFDVAPLGREISFLHVSAMS